MKKPTKKVPLPTKQQILEFVRESPTPVGKREIARAFGQYLSPVVIRDLMRAPADLASAGEAAAVDRDDRFDQTRSDR